MLPGTPMLLAASVTDWVERGAPIVLAAFAAAVVLLRSRERRRGTDDDEP